MHLIAAEALLQICSWMPPRGALLLLLLWSWCDAHGLLLLLLWSWCDAHGLLLLLLWLTCSKGRIPLQHFPLLLLPLLPQLLLVLSLFSIISVGLMPGHLLIPVLAPSRPPTSCR
jgi:hypothetical protein